VAHASEIKLTASPSHCHWQNCLCRLKDWQCVDRWICDRWRLAMRRQEIGNSSTGFANLCKTRIGNALVRIAGRRRFMQIRAGTFVSE
jgi:hypothetical protein